VARLRGVRREADEGVVEPTSRRPNEGKKQTGHNLRPQQRGCEKCGLAGLPVLLGADGHRVRPERFGHSSHVLG